MSPSSFPPELIAGLSLGAVWPVTMLVNLVKPLLERIPGLSPTAPADKAAHDAAIQLFNGVASLGVTLVLAMLGGYIQNPSQFWVMGVQIVGIMLASDFNYRGSAKSSGGGGAPVALAAPPLTTRLTVSPAQVADALNTAIQHARYVPPVAAQPAGMPNTVKTLADDATAPLAASASDSALATPTIRLPVVTPSSAPYRAI